MKIITLCILLLFPVALLGQLSVTMLRSDVLCNGDCNGSATALASNGTPPYNYLWNAAAGNQTTQTATGLCAGAYTVTVADAVASVVISNVTILQPTILNTVIDSTDVSCNGGNNGGADLTPSGGTLNRSVSLDGVNDYIEANNTGYAGYTSGLTMECWVWIDPTMASEGIILAFNQDAATGNRCWISVWPSGTFNIYAQDAGNGIGTNSYPLGQWHHVAATISSGNNRRLYVNGILEENSGTVTNEWQPQGVNELFSIGQEWDFPPATTSQHFKGRIDEVRVWNTVLSQATIQNHFNSCCPVDQTHPNYANLVGYWRMNEGVGTNVGDITGNGNSGLLINGNTWATPAQTDWGCFAQGTGYAYDWSTGATTEDISNLTAGMYYCTVTDGNCCMVIDSVNIDEPPVLTSTTAVLDVTCNGAGDGEGTVNPTGGTPVYTYLWDAATGNQTNQTATGLGPGTYFVTVTDNNNCTTVNSVVITEPLVLTAAMDSTDVLCNGGNMGTATATPAGGTPAYSYLWSSGSTNVNATGLSAGTYYVTITDANNCTVVDSIVVVEPTLVVPSVAAQNDAACFGYNDGDATVFGSGGIGPYSYLWDTLANSQTTAQATGLSAGTYTVTVTDSNGCDSAITVTISEPPPVIQSITPDQSMCLGDTAILSVVGGVSYLWDIGDSVASITVEPVSDTSFTVTVTDAGGCTEVATINITMDSVITITAGPDTTIVKGTVVMLNASGGTNYSWTPTTGLINPNSAIPIAGPTVTTTYYVTDLGPCATTDTVTVFIDDTKSIFVPNIFSPNGDGQNDVLYVRGNGLVSVTFIVYNRWGEKVFESGALEDGWDGFVNGERMNDGVFVYRVKATYYDDEEVTLKGNVTLVR